jgi:hypothetical protein
MNKSDSKIKIPSVASPILYIFVVLPLLGSTNNLLIVRSSVAYPSVRPFRRSDQISTHFDSFLRSLERAVDLAAKQKDAFGGI